MTSTHLMLEGDWPVLEQATPFSDMIFEAIKTAANGAAINPYLGYFSLGNFYIHTSLLNPHPTQRSINKGHVQLLKEEFKNKGIFRVENSGVVIGLGEGWNQMKNNGPVPFMINPTCPHLSHLSTTPNGPIAEVIRGGHRTEAVKTYATESNQPEESYWYYTVLIPGMILN
jgi:hypothetical protein